MGCRRPFEIVTKRRKRDVQRARHDPKARYDPKLRRFMLPVDEEPLPPGKKKGGNAMWKRVPGSFESGR